MIIYSLRSNCVQTSASTTNGKDFPENVKSSSIFSHYRLIFINLVTVSILLGIFPHTHLLTTFGLSEQFSPLIDAIKLGDRSAFRLHLDNNMEWFRGRYIYLILRSKGEVLVIRSLFRRAFVPFVLSITHQMKQRLHVGSCFRARCGLRTRTVNHQRFNLNTCSQQFVFHIDTLRSVTWISQRGTKLIWRHCARV